MSYYIIYQLTLSQLQKSTTPQPQPSPKPRPSRSPQPKPRVTPPQPKPRPPPPTTSDGRIDLDALEFDEFNLSDEDIAILASQMGDNKVSILSSYYIVCMLLLL